MTITPTEIVYPFNTNLTREWLAGYGFKPLFGGADWIFRVQLTDEAGAGSDLTGASARFLITDGTTDILRRSGITSTGASHAQIVFDDQSAEVGVTGTGWLTIYMHAVATEIAEFATLLTSIDEGASALCNYELGITFGGSFPSHPVLSGKIAVYKTLQAYPV